MNNPRCQYCGEEMEPKSSFGGRAATTPEEIKEFPWALTTYYECKRCHSRSPFCYTPEEARAAAMKMSAVECERALYEMSDADLDGAFTDWSVAYHNEDFEEAVAIIERWAWEHLKERSEK